MNYGQSYYYEEENFLDLIFPVLNSIIFQPLLVD